MFDEERNKRSDKNTIIISQKAHCHLLKAIVISTDSERSPEIGDDPYDSSIQKGYCHLDR